MKVAKEDNENAGETTVGESLFEPINDTGRQKVATGKEGMHRGRLRRQKGGNHGKAYGHGVTEPRDVSCWEWSEYYCRCDR